MNSDFRNHYLIKCAYDGSDFYGWAIQNDKRTVQGEFKKALDSIFGEYEWSVAGRTDRGVHAKGQAVALSIGYPFAADKVKEMVTRRLPPSILVGTVRKRSRKLDARREAASRTYKYFMKDISMFSPFERNYCVFEDLSSVNWETVKHGMSLFIGEHDFRNFCKEDDSIRSYVRIVLSFDLKLRDRAAVFTIEANAFLYNMVRKIIGALLLAGRGAIELDTLKTMLDSSENKRYLIKKAPPNGLYLWKVTF